MAQTLRETQQPYKYESHTPRPYNMTTNLVDVMVKNGFDNKIAIFYKDTTYTYRELQSLVNKVGNALDRLGVRMEDRVFLVMRDSPEAVACFLGAIKIGAIPIPVSTMYARDDYRYLLNDSRSRTLIADHDFVEEIEGHRQSLPYLENIIVVGETTKTHHHRFDDIVNCCSDKLEAAYTTSEDAAFWLYTSGSTGVPKAAVHLQHDAFTCIEGYAKGILDVRRDDILLSASKFFFAYGLGNSLFFPLSSGASVVLLSDRSLPETIFAAIDRYRPTIFFGVPTLYANMLQVGDAEGKYALSSLRICVSAGEALPTGIFCQWKQRFGIEILDGIGTTELLHIFLSNRPGDVKPGSTGKPVPGYCVRLVDDKGIEAPRGELGTLQVKGDSAAAFYYHHHDKTYASIQGGWFSTGDKFYQDGEGYYYYCGRGDDMLKVGGIWVSPIEIENVLISHSAVLEAAVVGKNDEHDLTKPMAYIVLKKGHQPSEKLVKEIQDFVKKSAAPYKYPRWVEFVQDLPKTSTGKIQRYKLRS